MSNLTRMAMIACLALVACSGSSLSVRRQMLEQTNVAAYFDAWVRAVSNMEQDSVAAIYDQVPELRIVYPNGRVSRGWEEERQLQTEFFDRVEHVNFVTRGREIEVVCPDVAITTFRYSLDVMIDGNLLPAPVEGIATIAWVKDPANERWKIHTQHASIAVPFDS